MANISKNGVVKISVGKHKFTELLTACLISFPAFIQASCPDLTNYFSLVEDQPGLVRDELLALTTECEESTEFCLLGSSQLALGDLLRAAENLELALLIDPENGSAMVDYAEVFIWDKVKYLVQLISINLFWRG